MHFLVFQVADERLSLGIWSVSYRLSVSSLIYSLPPPETRVKGLKEGLIDNIPDIQTWDLQKVWIFSLQEKIWPWWQASGTPALDVEVGWGWNEDLILKAYWLASQLEPSSGFSERC